MVTCSSPLSSYTVGCAGAVCSLESRCKDVVDIVRRDELRCQADLSAPGATSSAVALALVASADRLRLTAVVRRPVVECARQNGCTLARVRTLHRLDKTLAICAGGASGARRWPRRERARSSRPTCAAATTAATRPGTHTRAPRRRGWNSQSGSRRRRRRRPGLRRMRGPARQARRGRAAPCARRARPRR